MNFPAEGQPIIYTAVPDLVAYERVLKRHMKLRKDRWILYYFRAGCYCAVAGAFSSSVGQMALDQPFRWAALAAGACFGFLVGLIWVLVWLDTSIRAQVRRTRNLSWECRIDDYAYTIKDKDGVSTSIPWELIKIEFEDPDVWCIRFGKQTRFIFRGPLRSAGIEQAFLGHIPA